PPPAPQPTRFPNPAPPNTATFPKPTASPLCPATSVADRHYMKFFSATFNHDRPQEADPPSEKLLLDHSRLQRREFPGLQYPFKCAKRDLCRLANGQDFSPIRPRITRKLL